MAKKMSKKPAKKTPAKKPAKKAASKPARKPTKKSPAPKPVKTGRGPTPAEIGTAVVANINAGRPDKLIWDKFWSPAVASVEGAGVALGWTGRKAMEAKCNEWLAGHTIHGCAAEGPYLGASGFSVKLRMDVEDKSTGRRTLMEEIAVYTVLNGKIIREEFMYGSSTTLAAPAQERELAPIGG